MCLIEANQPVYPLDVTRTMREQRAMMIQNVVSVKGVTITSSHQLHLQNQYKFVCDAILTAYDDKIIQPLVDVLPNGSTRHTHI